MDYLSALLHARALTAEAVVIYPCSICHGAHVGHDKVRYSAHCERECQVKVAALLRRIRSHEHMIEEHRGIIARLKEKMESTIISYGCCIDAE